MKPLTPADSDLQDFPFMPLHVARLRDSDLAAEAAPEACWYAVLLWAASWHQLPAGSLPDNDAVLTKLIGLGRDVRTFRKHREEAMRGFVLCDDGRLYHPIVAEQVLAAWDSKLQQRWRTECARIKKQNQRNGTSLPAPTFEEFLAGTSPATTPPVPEDEANCPQGQSIQETGTGTGKLGEGSDDPSLSAAKAPSAKRRLPETSIPDDFPDAGAIAEAQAWTAEAGVTLDVTAHARRFRNHAATKDRRERNWPAAWRGWIDIEIERAPRAEAAPKPVHVTWDGPDWVWSLVAAPPRGEAFAVSWLGRAKWVEARQTIVLPNELSATRLQEQAGDDLAAGGVRLELQRAA